MHARKASRYLIAGRPAAILLGINKWVPRVTHILFLLSLAALVLSGACAAALP